VNQSVSTVRGAPVPEVAVVTGGASGIGRATVRLLLSGGWSVVVADLNVAGGEAVLAEAGSAGADGRAAFVPCDVTREEQVAAAVGVAVDRFGGLGCMVNNAGVPGAFGAITETEVEDWDYTLAVLLRGTFLGIKHAARAFAAQRTGGSIVNVASVAGLSGGAGPQAYSAAKAGVISLTQTTAVELAEQQVRVNAVAPGPVFTPILGKDGRDEHTLDLLSRAQPWPRAGRAEDVAATIGFLAGPAAGFITGTTITVDGGQTAAGPDEAMKRLSDPRSRRLAGVSRGSTGQPGTMRTLAP
jgi:NAD(P)-dependent dehydrogenase (short-subunit alcohol dehydrogenase family)